jgi:hypothetical protein
MSREQQRQINRLKRLANFIQNNPDKYDQSESHSCIVGLGLRLVGNQFLDRPVRDIETGSLTDEFVRRYGVNYFTTLNIYYSDFKDIHKSLAGGYRATPKQAVKVVNFLIQRKEKELSQQA